MAGKHSPVFQGLRPYQGPRKKQIRACGSLVCEPPQKACRIDTKLREFGPHGILKIGRRVFDSKHASGKTEKIMRGFFDWLRPKYLFACPQVLAQRYVAVKSSIVSEVAEEFECGLVLLPDPGNLDLFGRE